MEDKLAINGGKPVREIPLPPPYAGAGMYGEEEKKAVLEVLDRKSPFRYYGPDVAGKVKAFEKSFAQKIGTRHALGVTSGTASLVVALKALGIGPGDKVIIPANTFIATAGAVVIAGAVPVFADIDESLNIDPGDIERAADKHTKAVITVPILGNPCEMDRIMKTAEKCNLLVIEDVAQSCGCKYKGRYAGSFGDAGCFSLQINKIITTGEGGIVVTGNDRFYERAVRYHDHGMFREKEGFLATRDEDDIFVGQNYRMSEITGAVALEQLKKLDYIIDSMRRIKYRIKEQVKGIHGLGFRKINDEAGDAGNVLLIMLPDKDSAARFSNALNAENISNSPLYGGRPVYMHPQIFNQKTADKNGFSLNRSGDKTVYEMGMCPHTEEQLPKNICITICPTFSEKDADDIVRGIRKVARQIL